MRRCEEVRRKEKKIRFVPGSSSFIDEDTKHNWYMVVDSSNDPAWSMNIYRDDVLVAGGLTAHISDNTNDGRFGINNHGSSTDVAETHLDWYKIEAGAHPPIN